MSSACFAPIQRTLTADTGTYTIQPADLVLHAADACDVDVEVSRWWQSGVPSPALAPSASPLWAAQIRTISLSAVP